MEPNTPITIQKAITSKLSRLRIFDHVLFDRGQNSEQDVFLCRLTQTVVQERQLKCKI